MDEDWRWSPNSFALFSIASIDLELRAIKVGPLFRNANDGGLAEAVFLQKSKLRGDPRDDVLAEEVPVPPNDEYKVLQVFSSEKGL